MIKSHGVEDINGRKRYKFFEQEIFGLDRAVEKLVEEYFHSAARRLDVRKRILLLMGPVSGGNRPWSRCLNVVWNSTRGQMRVRYTQ